jgi:hypothetical protein
VAIVTSMQMLVEVQKYVDDCHPRKARAAPAGSHRHHIDAPSLRADLNESIT